MSQAVSGAAGSDHWFTTAELAALDLPGIPETRQGVEAMAKREEWQHPAAEGRLWRRRKGRGGRCDGQNSPGRHDRQAWK